MNTYAKKKFTILICFLGPIVVYSIFTLLSIDHHGKLKNQAYHFAGVVDHVSYDIKGEAFVTINDTDYSLTDPDWDFDHNRIQKGDSLVKRKNSMTIYLFKKNGQIITEGKEN